MTQTAWEDLSELEQLTNIYVEMHKDVYGVKARWAHFDSVEEANKAIEQLEAAGEEEFARDRALQEEAAVKFEARIQTVIESGAKDRETAMRWIHEAEGTDGDGERLCYNLGLKFGYFG